MGLISAAVRPVVFDAPAGIGAIAQALKVRVVVASSEDVYRNYDGLRGKVTTPPDPVSLSEDAPLRETRFPYRGQDVAFKYANDYEPRTVTQSVNRLIWKRSGKRRKQANSMT